MSQLVTVFSNPVLVKEFRQRWRTAKTPLIITLYLLVMGGFACFIMYQNYYKMGYIQLGQTKEVIMLLSLLQMGLIAFVAPGLSAGAISGERERQTLNILLTTNLSPASIIISKLMTSVSFILLLVVSTMPLYAMALLYGGVSPLQLLETFGFFILTILLCGSFGLLCSVWFKRTGVSTVVAYGVLFAFLAAAPFLSEVAREFWAAYQRYPNHPFLHNNPYLNSIPVILEGVSPFDMLLRLFGVRGDYGALVSYPFWITNPWPIFLTVIPLLILIFILLSIYLLHPVRPKLKWRRPKQL